ncbi:MAG: hypothetical protein GY841_00515 [FCB group bacterium]|nr:hypothetical protein [FCB group bacterium]
MIFLGGVATADKLLTIDGRQTVTDDPQNPDPPIEFYSGRAKEDFLGLERGKAFGLPTRATAAGEVDTITIVAIRADFVLEEPDDPTTTGIGVFDLRAKEDFIEQEGHGLDPAPHNLDYFEAHLRSLAQYWRVVSYGKLELIWEIWPKATDSAYHLDSSIAAYGSLPPAVGLGTLFYDALKKADEVDGDSLRFRDEEGRKKAVMIFHAGSDRQNDLWFSATPTENDLYTGFLTFDEFNQIELSHDTVVEGIIMPETMSQDNRITVMNAVMAHEFGHQLGLVDLYNTGSNPFLTQMGDFALMDNMGMNTAAMFDIYGVGAFGTVPLFPMAWSRAFLGFEEVVEYREGTSIELAAVKLQTSEAKIAKIPISATEYYLLENRRSDIDGELDGLRQDSTSDVILWPVVVESQTVGDSVETVLVPVREYDVYLPDNAAGIAIWHIDEAVAAEDYLPEPLEFNFDNNFDANSLQWDHRRRFVRLVEADGLIGFGGNYHQGFGKREDLFYSGNNSNFGTHTNPPTISNDGGYTHFNITNISSPAKIMTFNLSRNRMADNFPRRMSIPADPGLAPAAVDLDGDGEDEILSVSGNRLLAVYADGRDFLDTLGQWPDEDTIYSGIDAHTDANPYVPRQFTTAAMPVFAETGAVITTLPVTATFNDTTLVMAGTGAGKVYAYLTTANDAGEPDMYRAENFWVWEELLIPGGITGIIPDTDKGLVICFNDNRRMLFWDWNDPGTRKANVLDGDFVGACRFDGGLAVLAETATNSVLYQYAYDDLFNLDTLTPNSLEIDETGFHAPIATDFDRDGVEEVVLVSRTGHVLCYSLTAAGIEKYTDLDKNTGDTAVAGPAVADFSGNGFPELIIPGTNRIYGYDRTGLTAIDFPVTVDPARPGQLVLTEPIISDIDGDNRADIVVAALDSVFVTKPAAVFYLDSLSSPDTIYIKTKDTTFTYYNYFSNVYVVTPGRLQMSGFPVPAGTLGINEDGDTTFGVATPVHMKSGNEGRLAVAGADGWLNLWTTNWSDEAAFWPMAGGSADRSGYLTLDDLGEERALSEFLPEMRFFAYPNPATGSRANIHFYVNQAAGVTVTIFDAIGDKVWEGYRDIPDGNREEEIIWNLGDVASGVYHCRIEATASSGSHQAVAFKTIAVVK